MALGVTLVMNHEILFNKILSKEASDFFGLGAQSHEYFIRSSRLQHFRAVILRYIDQDKDRKKRP